MNKNCTKCGILKDFDQFYYRSDKPISACKSCTRSKISKYASTKRGRYVRAMSDAKFRKKEWMLTEVEYNSLIVQPCFYCDGFLDDRGNGIGLDRINNHKGYDLNNVVRCCSFCNYLRGDILTLEETQALVSLLINMRKKNIQEVA